MTVFSMLTIAAKRIGPLTEAAPDIGPMMWEEITGPDGIVRQMQWTSRVEGSNGEPSGGKLTAIIYGLADAF